MSVGIVLLIVLAVPTLFQVVMSSYKQKQRHDELIERINKLEEKLGAG